MRVNSCQVILGLKGKISINLWDSPFFLHRIPNFARSQDHLAWAFRTAAHRRLVASLTRHGPGKAACATIELMKEAPRQLLKRRSDEPKLEVGETVPIKEGVFGGCLTLGDKRNPYLAGPVTMARPS
jgi:hypothetical protein